MQGYIVEYSKNSKDIYTIKGVSTSGLAENKKVEINKGESAMTLDTKTVYANSKTVFLVQTGTGSKATYKSYTGYANVPDMKDNSGNFVTTARAVALWLPWSSSPMCPRALTTSCMSSAPRPAPR